MNSLLFSLLDSVKNETAATSTPTVNDDSSKGFSFGSIWFNSSSGKLYILINATQGAANWISVNGENYKGSWNASTNIPVLADGIGITGDNYLVSVAGSQNLGSGTITFVLGDLIIYDGTIWKKGGISYTPEDVANKSTDGTMTANSATLYPSQSAVVTYASAKVADSIVDGVTTIAPSQNAVFDALALKQTIAKDTSGGYAGLTLFKINFKNVANTFTSFFTNSNTAARTYTFPDRNGTILDDTDLGNIGLALSVKQDSSPTLTGLAATSIAADQLIYGSGINTFSTTDFTSAARTVLDDTTVAAMVNTLGGAASTGSGGLVRATSPALVTPALGTPASGVLTNCTGYTSANLPLGTSLQTIGIVKTDTASTTSSTYAAIAGIAATITPGHINNEVRVTVVLQVGGTALARGNFQLFRGATKICNGSAGGSRTQDAAVYYSPSVGSLGSVVIDFVDSPAANTATTYSVKWSSPDNVSTILLNRTLTDTNSAAFSRTASTIILTEIKG